MENTVTIEINEYNKLRDFYKGITEKKYVEIDSWSGKVYFYKESEIIENSYKVLKDMSDYNDSLAKEFKKFREEHSKFKTKSLWSFLKLKK